MWILPALACLAPPASADYKTYLARGDRRTAARLITNTGTLDVSQMPLQEVIETVAQKTGVEIDANWTALGTENIEPDRPVSFRTRNADTRTILELICRLARSQDPLAWGVQRGRVYLTTRQAESTSRLSRRSELPPQDTRKLPDLVYPDLWTGARPACSLHEETSGITILAPQYVHRRIETAHDLGRSRMNWKRLFGRQQRLRTTQVEFAWKQAPAASCIDQIAKAARVSIVLDQPALAAAGLALDQPVTLRLTGISARDALKLVLRQSAGSESLVISPLGPSQVQWVTTRGAAPLHLAAFVRSRIEPSRAGVSSLDQLPLTLRARIRPGSWHPAGRGGLALLGRRLMIMQTAETIATVGYLLEAADLKELLEAPSASPAPTPPSAKTPPDQARPDTPDKAPPRKAKPDKADKPRASAADEARASQKLQMAESYMRLRAWRAAGRLYREIVDKYPHTQSADKARKKLAELERAGF